MEAYFETAVEGAGAVDLFRFALDQEDGWGMGQEDREEILRRFASHAAELTAPEERDLEIAIEAAARHEAVQRNSNSVSVRDVLVGVLAATPSLGEYVLRNVGVPRSDVHYSIKRALEGSAGRSLRARPQVPQRILVTASMVPWVDEVDASAVIVDVVRALNTLHVAAGGVGLELDELQIMVRDAGVPAE